MDGTLTKTLPKYNANIKFNDLIHLNATLKNLEPDKDILCISFSRSATHKPGSMAQHYVVWAVIQFIQCRFAMNPFRMPKLLRMIKLNSQAVKIKHGVFNSSSLFYT